MKSVVLWALWIPALQVQGAARAGADERQVDLGIHGAGQVIESARPQVPPAGSGIDWRVLDQVVNGTVPAKLDSAACGPACLAMVLAERGIKMTQEELIRRSRATIHPEIKSKRVTSKALWSVLDALDPTGHWFGDGILSDNVLRGRTAHQVIEYLGERGPWIAQVGQHFVVVDGIEADGTVRIRDPWYEPARARGITSGSSYRVSLRTFVDQWHAAAIYRE